MSGYSGRQEATNGPKSLPTFPLTKIDVTTGSFFVETSSDRNPKMVLFPKETNRPPAGKLMTLGSFHSGKASSFSS